MTALSWVWVRIKPGVLLFVVSVITVTLGIHQLSLCTIEELDLLRQLGSHGYAYIGLVSAGAMALSMSIPSMILHPRKEDPR